MAGFFSTPNEYEEEALDSHAFVLDRFFSVCRNAFTSYSKDESYQPLLMPFEDWAYFGFHAFCAIYGIGLIVKTSYTDKASVPIVAHGILLDLCSSVLSAINCVLALITLFTRSLSTGVAGVFSYGCPS